MNSVSGWTADTQRTRHGIYFFLSYAHSAPMSERVRSDADPSVSVFFADLVAAVAARARPAAGMRIGFFDQQIPSGADMKVQLCDALGCAEVFVPLYSPGYFSKSWPMREQQVFRGRLRAASAATPDRHIVPVLWTPLLSWEQPPAMATALSIRADDSDYGENGLRALCMLTSYRQSYELVLAMLADEIVKVAERSPLGPSTAPDLDDVLDRVPAKAGFVVAMLSPEDDVLPGSPAVDGRTNAWWWAYAGRRIPPVAEHARNMAERLGLNALLGDFAEFESLFDQAPAIVFVDPWMVVDRGPEFLASTFAGLPDWVVPLLLDTHVEGSGPDPASALAEKAIAVLQSVRDVPVNRVDSMEKLEEILPTTVAKARRTYLRRGPVFPPAGPAKRRARLRDDGNPKATGNETRE